MRELDGRLEGRPEYERKLADVNRKLEALAQSHHAEVLNAHQSALRQRREVDTTLEQLQGTPGRIESLARDLLLDDWPEGTFAPATDQDALEWRAEAERLLTETREALTKAARALAKNVEALGADRRIAEWRRRADQAKSDYEALQAALAEQGVGDPREFGRLVQERQHLEAQLKQLQQLRRDRESHEADNQAQWKRVLGRAKGHHQSA